MKKIIVLGGTGFVGAHVCEKLVRAGWQLTLPTRR
ncbi:MAG: NAD-dependent epimerase/dehydratase family protein, partial [Rhodoferax sp.]